METEKSNVNTYSINHDIFEMLGYMVKELSNTTNEVYSKRYVGKVIAYDTTDETDRIKIQVYGVYDDIPTSALPWSYPMNENKAGDSLILPEINSLVSVYFEQDDIYRPFYTTKVKTQAISNTSATLSGSDFAFGDNMVLFENAENCLTFNRKTNRLIMKNISGAILNWNMGTATSEDAGSADTDGSFNLSVGKGNKSYSISAYQEGLKIGNGKADGSDSFVHIASDGVNVFSVGGAQLGTTNNNIVFDETTTMRSSSPGAVVPDPTGGPWCSIPVCPMTGVPHTGNLMTVSGTSKPVSVDVQSSTTINKKDMTAPTNLI
jgi:hypothetical protein